ncbi:MAG: Gx transporter family protein [Thioalkalivibrionaceae bacterium]
MPPSSATDQTGPYAQRERQIIALAIVAIALHIIESALPSPIPGVKPGLANIITLLAWQCLGLRAALLITTLRIIVSSLLLGSLFGPGFWLAAAGASAALVALGALSAVPDRRLGLIGRSTAMAIAHISAQLALVSAWLLPGTPLWSLWPVLGGAALLTGVTTGLLAARLLRTTGCKSDATSSASHDIPRS